MTLKSVKRIAARVLNCGRSRIAIVDEEKAGEALTADDVRELVKNGGIKQKPVKGTGRAKAREKKAKKRKGRKKGPGRVKGSKGDSKKRWMERVRAQRALLLKLKPLLKKGEYAKLYRRVKGNNFKSKKALLTHVHENKLLK
jgi:large subunit ribosomal protein L19e